MSDGTSAESQRAIITERINESWDKVIGFVNKILVAHVHFGFQKIEASLNPSIKDILKGLSVADFLLNEFVESELLEYDEVRMALNSRQCILHMQLLAAALETNDESKYQEAIKLLESQAKF